QSGAEEGDPTQLQVEPVARRANGGDHDEESPKAVDDARYCRKELDQVFEKRLYLIGQFFEERMELYVKYPERSEDTLREEAFAQENGSCHSEGGADDEGQPGCVEGAPDLGEDAELPGVRVPGGAPQEADALLA